MIMVLDPCALSTLNDNAACLNCLSKSEKEDAFLFYIAKALVGEGGADYTDINDLRDAVKCWCVGGATLDSMKARVAINAAVNSTELEAAPTISEVRDAIKCWNCGIGGGERRAMEVFLLCKLFEETISGPLLI